MYRVSDRCSSRAARARALQDPDEERGEEQPENQRPDPCPYFRKEFGGQFEARLDAELPNEETGQHVSVSSASASWIADSQLSDSITDIATPD